MSLVTAKLTISCVAIASQFFINNDACLCVHIVHTSNKYISMATVSTITDVHNLVCLLPVQFLFTSAINCRAEHLWCFTTIISRRYSKTFIIWSPQVLKTHYIWMMTLFDALTHTYVSHLMNELTVQNKYLAM